MSKDNLNNFQLKLHEKTISLINIFNVSFSEEIKGSSEKYVLINVSSLDLKIWIYEDGSEFRWEKNENFFEIEDYKSLDDLGGKFLSSLESLMKSNTKSENSGIDK